MAQPPLLPRNSKHPKGRVNDSHIPQPHCINKTVNPCDVSSLSPHIRVGETSPRGVKWHASINGDAETGHRMTFKPSVRHTCPL